MFAHLSPTAATDTALVTRRGSVATGRRGGAFTPGFGCRGFVHLVALIERESMPKSPAAWLSHVFTAFATSSCSSRA